MKKNISILGVLITPIFGLTPICFFFKGVRKPSTDLIRKPLGWNSKAKNYNSLGTLRTRVPRSFT